mmetsp:Transcript_22562/g.19267  ORF Transcript_22562/g.19267 Transcript_22562/m.19267 type:complete len:163 (-) Transcript_22562:52-540(-)
MASTSIDNTFRGYGGGTSNTSLKFNNNEYDGNILTRILGCIASLAILVVSILGHFAFAEEIRNPLTTMLCVLYLVIGIILIIIEFMPNISLSNSIFQEVQFLRHLNGKSFFYLFIGLLFICQGSIVNNTKVSSWMFISVGIYLDLIAIVFFLLSFKLNRSAS